MADYDLIIRNGYVVDGSGLPRKRVDVGIKDGKITRLAHLRDAKGTEEIDAAGMIVAPGIVDPHTHYDPQITFDPYAVMSCFHGVTTIVAGNCGFSVAPCKTEDRPFLEAIFASVEDMDPISLSAVRWDKFQTFGEFLASLKGNLGVNFACYVGHSNVRRWVMGDDCYTRTATDKEIAAMCALVAEAMKAGAAGFSSSAAPTHLDIKGRPVPSRMSDRKELLALVEETGKHRTCSVSYLPASAISGLTQEDQDYLVELSLRGGVPVIIQGLGGRNKVDAPTATWEASEKFLRDATAKGAPVYSLLIARPFDRAIRIGPENGLYRAAFAWHEMFQLAKPERIKHLRDPAVREKLRTNVENYNRDPSKGTTLPPPLWSAVYVDETTAPENKGLAGRSIQDIAKERGVAPADAMLDIALAEDLDVTFRWRTESPEWRDAVGKAQYNPHMIIGVSDGGAHLGRDDGADWSSYFLGSWVRDRKHWTLEEGIRQITQVPAGLLGLSDRGTLKVGGWADIMIFDPETIAPWKKEFVKDGPGGVGRWKAWGKGVRATIVNGQPIVMDGKLTKKISPATWLRRDNTLMSLAAESVLVTGASQGVGRGIALAAAAAGAAVTVTARKIEAAEPVAKEIRERGGRALAAVCDVTARKHVEAAVAAAVAKFGGLSALVHNAVSAQSSVPVPIEKVEDPYWNDQIAVALRGSFHCAQAALPHLRKAKGSLILLTSNGGIEGAVTLPVYAATKGAQRGFVKSLAREWGPLGVRVNAVAPVAMTPAMENYFKLQPKMIPVIEGRGALGRLGDSENDIGRAVNFLIGRDSGFVTGQTLVLTGGAYML